MGCASSRMDILFENAQLGIHLSPLISDQLLRDLVPQAPSSLGPRCLVPNSQRLLPILYSLLPTLPSSPVDPPYAHCRTFDVRS